MRVRLIAALLGVALATRPASAADPLAALAHLPLGSSPDWWASIGGEARERFEWTGAPGFGAQPRDDDGQWLHRVKLDVGAQLGRYVRAELSLKSALQSGRAEGPRPADVDRLDLHQALAEATLPLPRGGSIALELGRQEMAYGSSRLVSVRASPNVRRSFDAARLHVARGPWRADALLARLAGTRGAFDLDWEAVLQTGDFGEDAILAWTFASQSGYTLADLPGKPRLGFGADVASGDSGRGALGTFDALFPRGTYFGEAALIGPQNLIDVSPSLDVVLHPSLTVGIDAVWFWRERREDGLYSGSGALVRSAGDGGRARYVGARTGAKLEWTPIEHWTFALVYEHYFAGRFLSQSGAGEDLDFVGTWIEFAL